MLARRVRKPLTSTWIAAYADPIRQDVPLSRTPDFYDYAEQPLAAADMDGEFVVVRWPDGAWLRIHALWLFENQMGDVTIDERTREGKTDPADLPDANILVGAAVGGNGDLDVSWSDGSIARYHSGWLRHIADSRHRPQASIPAPVEWTTADFAEPITVDGPATLTDDRALYEFLESLARYGLVRLEGLDITRDVLPALGRRIGALRDTNFGITWPVTVDLKPTSTAVTPLPLPPHTDLPTRETPPGFQMLHCLVNTCAAGFSTMADGYAVVRHLREHQPDVHDVLANTNWVFFNRSPEHDHRWTGPLIDYGAPGMPLTLRAFHPLRAFPDMDDADVPAAYAALREFSRLAGSDEFQMRYPFRPGDLVAFDNRRLLHGRASIDADGGQRELHGTYIDHDEVYSRLRVLSRNLT
jgi:gamma-butyrobetaine dioxygenase